MGRSNAVAQRFTAAMLVVCVSLMALPQLALADAASDRRPHGLVLLYDFGTTDGGRVIDRSGVGQAMPLRISDKHVISRVRGALHVHRPMIIRTDQPATKLIDAVRKSNEISIEAWITPANTRQEGPARIVTLSSNTSNRNLTLGQEKDRYDFRLRTTKTSTNGMPSLASSRNAVKTLVTHVVYTRNARGEATLYINGKKAGDRKVSGDMSKWDRSYRFALANELSGDRPWSGTYYLVAAYSKALPRNVVEKLYRAGQGNFDSKALAQALKNAPKPSKPNDPEGRPSTNKPPQPAVVDRLAARHFRQRIAPLLATHCLECHGWKSTKAGLDLTQRITAYRGGRDGVVLKPGDANGSKLWKDVQSDDMPEDRPPLTLHEKRLLREWIEAGAPWPDGKIEQPTTDTKLAGAEWVRRLTVSEYIATVEVATGVDITDDARKLLPHDMRADGFSNTAYNLTVDMGHVEAYSKLAAIIAKRVDIDGLLKQHTRYRAAQLSFGTMRDIANQVGRWVLRGPLQPHEIASFMAVSDAIRRAGGNANEAFQFVLEAMLQSPRFLYRIESQTSQGSAKSKALTGYELASRMSYMLWGAPPDKQLMRAADAGELSNKGSVARQVQRMLVDPRTKTRSAEFVHEWLHLDRLQYMRPNSKRFPNWDPALAEDMRKETIAFFMDVSWSQKRPLRELFNAQVTYLTPRLAKHYGVTPPTNKPSSRDATTPVRYDLSKTPSRGGLLTQGSVLTIGGDDASMVTRGLFVLHDVLRGKVKSPPSGIDTTPKPAEPGLSRRAVAETRVADVSCGGCHSKFEPLAYGLEKFDGLGSFKLKDEHNNTLREDGEVIFPGHPEGSKASETPIPYRTIGQLMNMLGSSERVGETITWKIAQFALGRPMTEKDAPQLAKIHAEAKRRGGTYADVIAAIVLSEMVLKR